MERTLKTKKRIDSVEALEAYFQQIVNEVKRREEKGLTLKENCVSVHIVKIQNEDEWGEDF